MVQNYKYLEQKESEYRAKPTNANISALLKINKLEKKKEKRQNIYLAAAAMSVLALSGFIISQ